MTESSLSRWVPGSAPVTVIMISLNEGHNIDAVCENLRGWAQEVIIVDSYSKDNTVDAALRNGVQVVQRRFRGYGDQWNFALNALSISSKWTMKLDPDERLSDELKHSLSDAMGGEMFDGLSVTLNLWFMGERLPVRQPLLRAWRTGSCRFTEISVNEYPRVAGRLGHVNGVLAHLDSPDLEHWLDKQNRYTTAEAIIAFNRSGLADTPRFFGTRLQRRMWMKRNFRHLPFRYLLFFLYNWLLRGAWRAGRVGFVWARLRSDVMRFCDYKRLEIEITGNLPITHFYGPGQPDDRVKQHD